jgi:hypothetical protein
MTKGYGDVPKARVWKLIEVLLDYVDVDGDVDKNNKPDCLRFNQYWKDNLTLEIHTTYEDLAILLYGRAWLEKPPKYKKNDKKELSECVAYYLMTFLKRAKRHLYGKGVKELHITLELWSKEKTKNKEEFEKAWEEARAKRGLSQSPIEQQGDENHLIERENEDIKFLEIYVERPPIEDECYTEIQKHGALIRIKSPQHMGKTLLINKTLDHVEKTLGSDGKRLYQIVEFNFDDSSVFQEYESFLKWFCLCISDKLKIQQKITNSWQESLGLHRNVTNYFEDTLLPKIQSNLVLVIDDFEILFEYTSIFKEFCYLIHSWHKKAVRTLIWRKLRIILVHSTQTYPKLDINRSPFNNVIKALTLRGFTQNEVEYLVRSYQLEQRLNNQDLDSLTKLVNGNPYLIQEALAYLKYQDNGIGIQHLLDTASTEEGIFSDHLRQQLESLEENSSLQQSYEKVIRSDKPVKIDSSKLRFQLHSLGLIKFSGNNCLSSCDLYRNYFLDILVNNNQL